MRLNSLCYGSRWEGEVVCLMFRYGCGDIIPMQPQYNPNITPIFITLI